VQPWPTSAIAYWWWILDPQSNASTGSESTPATSTPPCMTYFLHDVPLEDWHRADEHQESLRLAGHDRSRRRRDRACPRFSRELRLRGRSTPSRAISPSPHRLAHLARAHHGEWAAARDRGALCRSSASTTRSRARSASPRTDRAPCVANLNPALEVSRSS